MRFSDLPASGVVVWGYGREGRAVAEELVRRGVSGVVALPDAAAEPVEAVLPARYGEEAVAALRSAAVVVKSPGIPASSRLYGELRDAGVTLTSLMDLWLSEHADRVVGVTGTKGKSTTASLIAHLLAGAGRRSAVVGNVGSPVLSVDPSALDTVVVEVSSYQAQSLTVSPRVAVVTSLFPEHVPWHGSVQQYIDDKLNLLAHGPEHVVLPHGDAGLRDLVLARLDQRTTVHLTDGSHAHVDEAGDLVWPGVGRVAAVDLPLAGRHNAENCALAIRAVEATGALTGDADRAAVLRALATFRPLEHRLEPLASRDGRTWIDDSLATAPEAVVAALQVWEDEAVALLFGGADRGLDLTPLVDYLRSRPTPVWVLAFGAAGARLGEVFPVGTAHGVTGCSSFADAVRTALSPDNPARTVLFSPGAPSFDEYADYRERSAALRAMIAPD